MIFEARRISLRNAPSHHPPFPFHKLHSRDEAWPSIAFFLFQSFFCIAPVQRIPQFPFRSRLSSYLFPIVRADQTFMISPFLTPKGKIPDRSSRPRLSKESFCHLLPFTFIKGIESHFVIHPLSILGRVLALLLSDSSFRVCLLSGANPRLYAKQSSAQFGGVAVLRKNFVSA